VGLGLIFPSTLSDSATVELGDKRILILSDTHLGRPRGGVRSAAALRPLWQGSDRLIINGDTAEVHDHGCRAVAAREVLALREMCEADGVELTLLSGNHDPLLTDLRHIQLFGEEVFVTHGDVLHPAISPWTPHARRLSELHAQARCAALDHGGGDAETTVYDAAQYAAHFQWDEFVTKPQHHHGWVGRKVEAMVKMARVMWYWHTLPRRAAAFARWYAPHCRYFIFGHIHRAGVWRDGERVLINTGAYTFPARPRAVVLAAGRLSVVPIVFHHQTYHLSSTPLRQYDLYQRAA
jgi:predicted phosphodiesterase